jgi:polyisoprenoid-binding protein YceI
VPSGGLRPMSFRSTVRNKWTWIIGVPVLLVVIFVGGPFVYINFIKDDAPPPLKLESVDTKATSSSTTAATSASIDGTWKVTSGSQVGYRAKEVLFGQSAEAAGRTTEVTGTMTITGTKVDDASFTADLTGLKSDSGNRDDQVQGRILNTSEFPNATFELTEPIDLGTVPADLQEITVDASGDLTIHGTTKPITITITARRNGEVIETNGSIPITWSDYGIDSPSGGPATVESSGSMEFLITFQPAT